MEGSMRTGRVRGRLASAAGAVLMVALVATSVAAQGAQDAQDARRPTVGAVEGIVGHAAFADEQLIHHSVFGVAAPLRLTKRLAIGPEVVRMIGPRQDRDWILAAAVWWDITSPGPLRPGKVVPFVSGGFGLLSNNTGFGTFNRQYYGGGGGVRVHLTDRLYIAPEVVFAAELHLRTVARIGYHIPHSRQAGSR
jgi:hypothetical protein